MSDPDHAAARAVLSGFNETDPVPTRVSQALGTSALTLPRSSDGYTALSNDAYEATVGGRSVSELVLALGRPDTDIARIEAARERVALMARIQSPYVVQILSPVVVLDGHPGALCWLEEPTLTDALADDERTPIRSGRSSERVRSSPSWARGSRSSTIWGHGRGPGWEG